MENGVTIALTDTSTIHQKTKKFWQSLQCAQVTRLHGLVCRVDGKRQIIYINNQKSFKLPNVYTIRKHTITKVFKFPNVQITRKQRPHFEN
jgi:hypothetical protein